MINWVFNKLNVIHVGILKQCSRCLMYVQVEAFLEVAPEEVALFRADGDLLFASDIA